MELNYLEGVKKQLEYYKMLGEKTMSQVTDAGLFWQYNADSNSIAIIVKHLCGNMLSRWTGFLESDGEKDWRNRDAEFEGDMTTREEVMSLWNKGWACVFEAINPLTEQDLNRIVYIRNQGHSVVDAINRQLAHYPYHVGQIVFIGKMLQGEKWISLSIPKGKSAEFNAEKFEKPKEMGHFTDEFVLRGKG